MILPKPAEFFRTSYDYLTLVAWAFWMGGFSFYFGVVIRVGGQVVGDTSQGFVTQGVTWWLNVIATISLAIFLGSSLLLRSRYLMATWIAMVVAQGILFLLHARLDGLLDSTSQVIQQREPFETVHEWYEFTSAIQWLSAMLFLGGWVVLKAMPTPRAAHDPSD